MNPKLWNDFVIFSKAQLESRDIDPAYPILEHAVAGLSREEQLWRLFLYVTYYHLGSAEQAWNIVGDRPKLHDLVFPTGVERRGMRGNHARVARFTESLLKAIEPYGGMGDWVLASATRGGWDTVRHDFEKLNGAGPWASYKWADLLKNVLRYPLTATDIGGQGGPIPGLKRLVGDGDWPMLSVDSHAQRIYNLTKNEGIPFDGLDQFETALCDFNSLCKGNYYVGADIDAMMDQLNYDSPMWDYRRISFSGRWLGELPENNWNGLDRDRLKVYRETGEVVLR